MKKLLITVLLSMTALVACGTAEEKKDPVVQGTKTETEQTIILYKSDANAEHTMPFEERYNEEADLVRFIFSKVNEHDVVLLDYTLEEDDTSLILNLGDDVYTIQGSAGTAMFVETLARSYFENMPKLQNITFIHKGSYESILDHMKIGEPYSRMDFNE